MRISSQDIFGSGFMKIFQPPLTESVTKTLRLQLQITEKDDTRRQTAECGFNGHWPQRSKKKKKKEKGTRIK